MPARRTRRRSRPAASLADTPAPTGILSRLAMETGRSESHLSRVIRGERVSKALTAEIETAAGRPIAEIREQLARDGVDRAVASAQRAGVNVSVAVTPAP
jgi:hypothetical protein